MEVVQTIVDPESWDEYGPSSTEAARHWSGAMETSIKLF